LKPERAAEGSYGTFLRDPKVAGSNEIKNSGIPALAISSPIF